MLFKKFIQKSSQKEAQNRLLKFSVVSLSIAVVISSFLSYRAVKTQRTILLPPVINTKMTFDGYKASDEYLKEFVRYSLGLALSYSPVTARANFSELLSLFAPEVFAEEKEGLYSLADRIETNRISAVFYIYDMNILPDTIEVRGMSKQLQDKSILSEETKTYFINYRVVDGRFMIIKIFEKRNGAA